MSTLLQERPSTRDPEVTVRVVAEDARRGGRGGGGGFTFGGMLRTASLGAIAVAIMLVVGAITGLVDLGGLFGSSKTTTTTRVLLKELKSLSDYNAAQGVYQVDVTIDGNVPIVPDFIAAEDITFRAVGTVDATVDFSVLATDAVQVTADGATTITLTRPALSKAFVDPKQSSVINRSRGIVNRIGDIFEENPTDDRELYVKASRKIERAAHESKLAERARENTVNMLTGFLGRLGFTDVRVTFEKPVVKAQTNQG
jgi:hypothetical protein